MCVCANARQPGDVSDGCERGGGRAHPHGDLPPAIPGTFDVMCRIHDLLGRLKAKSTASVLSDWVLAVAGGGGRGCDVDHVQLQQDKRELLVQP